MSEFVQRIEDDQMERHRIWSILEDLWLDTEFMDAGELWAKDLAKRLKATGYDWGEIDHIYRYEVFPALYFNLLDIAGEWAGFDSDWLAARIRKKAGRAMHKHKVSLEYKVFGHFTDDIWSRVRANFTGSRQESP